MFKKGFSLLGRIVATCLKSVLFDVVILSNVSQISNMFLNCLGDLKVILCAWLERIEELVRFSWGNFQVLSFCLGRSIKVINSFMDIYTISYFLWYYPSWVFFKKCFLD
eukprot:TRINITY_DN8459_c0_g1_i1.p3 TRINITY_DN8459_c0_g1~~TRINITY_DN8459_c0_g1_i1.p3  ORF type:complete len:109 (+),score=4.19 TRINITY_DN8459_c0_g1_i1:158-484(+)